MKKILLVFAVILILLLSFAFAKDQILKAGITTASSALIGAPVHIDSFSLGILKQSVTIRGLRLYNPKGFPSGVLINVPTIDVSCDIGALAQKKLHLKNVEINIRELNIVRNKEGKLNVEALKIAEKKSEEKKVEQPSEQIPMQIDVLKLDTGEVIYTDYSKGEPPTVQVYDSGIHGKTYTNITSAHQLVALVLSESMKNTAIQSAKIYAASAVMSAGFLPAGAAITLFGKDASQQNFDVAYDTAFRTALTITQNNATVKSQDKTKGVISASMADKTALTVKVVQLTPKSTQISVAARKLLLPKPEIAKGILLQISEKLK